MYTVATIIYDSVNPFELGVATEVFAVERPELGVPWYRFLLCAVMSPRTFARRFRATLGASPYHWLLQQRIALAQRLLETADDPIENIATQCGFSSAATLRLHFRRFLGLPPQSYRTTFQSTSA